MKIVEQIKHLMKEKLIPFHLQQFVFCEELHGLGARGLDLSGSVGDPDHGGSEDLSRYSRASPLRWGKRTTGQVSVQICDHIILMTITETFRVFF